MRICILLIANSFFETSGSTFQATQRHISEELNSRVHVFKGMKILKNQTKLSLLSPNRTSKSHFPLPRLRKENCQ
jgi:hypothetical protein